MIGRVRPILTAKTMNNITIIMINAADITAPIYSFTPQKMNAQEKFKVRVFKREVRGLGEAVNLNLFVQEIHGLPSMEIFINNLPYL
ncbi:hypothetical protein [Thermoplasma sp. Kam2015]|uniref:hypothetical protein n=1 Tax=Thermoplasma sp. Kam2015 TaxID=2094122 RepID=UPI0012937A41|nr:hypothetical protein [Thermoplasma sp. Kam2015]